MHNNKRWLVEHRHHTECDDCFPGTAWATQDAFRVRRDDRLRRLDLLRPQLLAELEPLRLPDHRVVDLLHFDSFLGEELDDLPLRAPGKHDELPLLFPGKEFLGDVPGPEPHAPEIRLLRVLLGEQLLQVVQHPTGEVLDWQDELGVYSHLDLHRFFGKETAAFRRLRNCRSSMSCRLEIYSLLLLHSDKNAYPSSKNAS